MSEFDALTHRIRPLLLVRRWFWLPMLVGAVLFVGQYLALGSRSPFPVGWGPIVADDVVQLRADSVLPVPRDGLVIRQTFVPRWDYLREVELVLVPTGDVAENGRFQLQLFDDTDTLIAEQDLTATMFANEQTHVFRFAPQPRAAWRTYTLVMRGNSANTVTLRGCSLDSYADGTLTVDAGPLAVSSPETAVQELRFVTRYELGWRNALVALGTVLYFDGGYMLLALLFIVMPGCLLLWLGPAWWRRWDPMAWWGTAVALGISVWALLWYGVTLLGGHMTGISLWLLFGGGWMAALWAWWRRSAAEETAVTPPSDKWRWSHAFLLILLLLAFAVRLLAVRGINAPPWVDSGRHSLITAVMVETGQTPSDYADFLPVDRFPYHFGFHTIPASLHLMSGWAMNYMLLYLGQMLNALVPLAVYTAVWLTTRRRGAALIAAFLPALPFFFPGYYVSWGRLTQLTGVVILPVLLAGVWQLVRGAKQWRQLWWVVALLTAGLFLVHFRVFAYFVPFVPVVWGISLGRNGRALTAAMTTAFLLLLPRILQLQALTNTQRVFSGGTTSYHAFPVSYLNSGWEWHFVYLAGVGLLVTLVDRIRRRRWSVLPSALAIWVGLLFILLSGERIGLPSTSVVNYNSMYIIVFVPLAIFLGVTWTALWQWLARIHWLAFVVGTAVFGAALTAAIIFGVRFQINILNPQTVLAQPADMAAMPWIEANLPADAKIGVNSWRWLGNIYSATDGGVWIVPLTKRMTTTPPADYSYSPELVQQVTAYNEAAAAVTDWRDPAVAAWLREQGVTHLYVGPRDGFMQPEALAANPALEMVYGRDGVFIFAIKPK